MGRDPEVNEPVDEPAVGKGDEPRCATVRRQTGRSRMWETSQNPLQDSQIPTAGTTRRRTPYLTRDDFSLLAVEVHFASPDERNRYCPDRDLQEKWKRGNWKGVSAGERTRKKCEGLRAACDSPPCRGGEVKEREGNEERARGRLGKAGGSSALARYKSTAWVAIRELEGEVGAQVLPKCSGGQVATGIPRNGGGGLGRDTGGCVSRETLAPLEWI